MNYKRIETLLESNPGLTKEKIVRGMHNDTILGMTAQFIDDPKTIELLIKHGADVNALDEVIQETPLFMAAEKGHVDVMRVLLESGADKHIGDYVGLTPLHIAVKENKLNAVQLLLNKGAEVNAKALVVHLTPLAIAVREGNEEMVKLLIEHGADVNLAVVEHITPLHIATKENKPNVVQLLLAHGANVYAQNDRGFTPLCFPTAVGYTDVVRLLLESDDSKVNELDKYKETLLHKAAASSKQPKVVQLLLEHGANPAITNPNGFTPAQVARNVGHKDIACLIENWKRDPQPEDGI